MRRCALQLGNLEKESWQSGQWKRDEERIASFLCVGRAGNKGRRSTRRLSTKFCLADHAGNGKDRAAWRRLQTSIATILGADCGAWPLNGHADGEVSRVGRGAAARMFQYFTPLLTAARRFVTRACGWCRASKCMCEFAPILHVSLGYVCGITCPVGAYSSHRNGARRFTPPTQTNRWAARHAALTH